MWSSPTLKAAQYLRLLSSASGPEIVDLLGLNGPLLPHNPLEKVGGEALQLFPVGFAAGGGRLDPSQIGDFRPGGSVG